jgi:hypothetical protein
MAAGNILNFLPAIIHYQFPVVLLFYPVWRFWCAEWGDAGIKG